MNSAEQSSLAWALADPVIKRVHWSKRSWLCAKIGAGEHAAAIRDLLVIYSRRGLEMPEELANSVDSWIDGYRGSEAEDILRALFATVAVAVTDEAGPCSPQCARPGRALAG